MNKTDLIESIAKTADIPKATAAKLVDAYHSTVTKAIAGGDKVTIPGFGSFSASERKERSGRNPRTGAVLTVKAAKVPKFKPGKSLRDALH